MAVRGAPAIGCAAAYGLALTARSGEDFEKARATLLAARPTAVNLRWALERLAGVRPRTFEALLAEADRVLREDLEACRAIGRNGAALVPDGKGILTHCNAGGLATSGYGTALGVVRAAIEGGKRCDVFADETRPWLQGARLTAWELLQDGIPVTLLPDAAAASLLASGKIGCVVVGADRIARNGDTANKIGTYPLALAAQAAGVPFFVAAPTSTVDLRAASGAEIPIEERAASEVTHLAGQRIAPEGVLVFNPAFDVTPARYIAAIVTERGVARAPYEASLAGLVSR
jgi:methylthioribose-1-phosphate isomerase